MRSLLLASAFFAAVAAAPASAALLDVPLPTNTYITFGGLDWAWASPCSPTGCITGTDVLDLSFQGPLGWRLPTAVELLARPAPIDFSFAGANVPLGGASVEGTIFNGGMPGDGACAAAYFRAGFFNLCDYDDAQIGLIFGVWHDPNPNGRNVETWLVRGGNAAIPEPASWAMLIAGFGLVGAAMRRRKVAIAA